MISKERPPPPPRPPGLTRSDDGAGAARAERFADAAALLERARRVSAPSMFRALLYHPCFALYSVQPELRPLFLADGRPLPDPLDTP